VFSLIALGRPKDAEQAAEAVLTAHLGFHPDDASPRLIDLFANIRRRIAPELLTSMYVNAKALLDRKDREGAIKAFTEVVETAADPDLKDNETIAELGLLAKGFLDLSRALPTAAVKDGASASAAPPPLSTVVSWAQPIREDFPRWAPPATLRRAEYKGRILVHVSVDGKVDGAEIVDSIHPLYDQLLLRASKGWLYKPSLINGTPVPSDHIVQVVLQPRTDSPR
jgi:hypothetical protein